MVIAGQHPRPTSSPQCAAIPAVRRAGHVPYGTGGIDACQLLVIA